MAKVAAHGSVSSNSLHFGGGVLRVNNGVKRKTPSELRGEQLKRGDSAEIVDESSSPFLGFTKDTDGESRFRKVDSLKNPRYIDTRMDEVYPVTKPCSRLRKLSGKGISKENSLMEQTASLKNSSVPSNCAGKNQLMPSCLENSIASASVAKDGTDRAHQTTEKCSQSTFRTVAELSVGSEKLYGQQTVDMDMALKGMIARNPPAVSSLPAESSNRFDDLQSNYLANFCSEFHIPGQKAPLDFTLKTSIRVVSSSSVSWFHRLIMSGTYHGMNSSTQLSTIHSWVYPQSSLPPSAISALSTEGVEADFLIKRQLAWQDSFRNLYYMLRKNACDIFYVCTSQFIVMFIGGYYFGRTRRSCSAYMSRSTKGLRSLLREHDVSFSMPLCRSKAEQVTVEDLVELSEIERHNFGQTRRVASSSAVDNSQQSLLAFSGNDNVHGLYDFLFNYRNSLTSLTGADVPVLFSPMPFQNASLSAPEVRCKEMKRADHVALPFQGYNMKGGELNQGSSPSLCYSIEIKDAYLPPWVICNICAIMGSEGRSFEASFTTESISTGMNVALATIHKECNPKIEEIGSHEDNSHPPGISNAVLTPHLQFALLKGLKYYNSSYAVSLSPV